MDDGSHGVALVEVVGGNLLVLGEDELVLLVVEEQCLTLPALVYLTAHQVALQVFELVVDSVLLKVQNLACKGLAKVQNGAASKLGKVNLAGVLLAYLTVGVIIVTSIGQTNLLVGILHLTIGNNLEILVDLAVALIGVHNHVEILVTAKHLGNHAAKRLLQDTNHSGLVDILQLFKLRKLVGHIDRFYFLSHNCV